MKSTSLPSLRILSFCLVVGSLFLMTALSSVLGEGAPLRAGEEAIVGELGSGLVPFGGSTQPPPALRDLGNGFYSFFLPLTPEIRQQLEEAGLSEDPSEKAAAPLTVISVGQAPATPSTPVTTDHGALSDTTYPYTYWVITLNLGSTTVTKRTTWSLAGPGLHFTRSANVVYGAGGIWGIGYRPGTGVRVPGIYTFQGSVTGAGSITTKSFAVNP